MAKTQKQQPAAHPDGVAVLKPKPIAVAAAELTNAPIPNSMAVPLSTIGTGNTWEGLNAHAEDVALCIADMAAKVNDSIQLVKTYGCIHQEEFKATVACANADFLKFADDFNSVRKKHAGRTGVIAHPDEIALALQVHEDYMQFQTYFSGALHHTQICLTEFALEAADLARKRDAEAQAGEAVATSTPAPSTEQPVEQPAA